jgi:hypothetical protein
VLKVVCIDEVHSMELNGKPPRNQKAREKLWALAASVALGLIPGLVFARQMMASRQSPSNVWEGLCGILSLPGLMLTPLPHMGPGALVVAIPVSMFFYFGVTWAIIRFLRWYYESPHE